MLNDMETCGNIESTVRAIFDQALKERRNLHRVPREFRIRFNAEHIEVFPGDAQKISASTTNLEKFSGRPIASNSLQPRLCIPRCEPTLFRQIQVLEIAVCLTNAFGCCRGGIRAESKMGSPFTDVVQPTGLATNQRTIKPRSKKYRRWIGGPAEVARNHLLRRFSV